MNFSKNFLFLRDIRFDAVFDADFENAIYFALQWSRVENNARFESRFYVFCLIMTSNEKKLNFLNYKKIQKETKYIFL